MTIWFAQNSTVNIDSVDQWNDVADGSGNWLTWASLDPADILVANAKTAITINVDVTCVRITTSNADGGTAGGGFLLAAGVTVTADVVAGTTACVVRTAAGDESFIVGDVIGGSGHSAYGANNNSNGTLTITGNVTGGSSVFADGARNHSSGTLTITGDVTGGSGNAGHGAHNQSIGTLTITGNVTGGSGTSNIGANNNSNGTLTITGNVTGGSGSTAFGARNASTNTLTISGSITAGNGAGAAGLVSLSSGLCLLSGEVFTADVSGNTPIAANRVLIKATGTIEQSYRVNDAGIPGVARSLFTGGTNLGQPVIADVRFGTTFGATSEYEGTLRVPDPAYVSLGVLTDNTVGSLTAGLDETALHDALDTYTNKGDWKATGFPDVAAFEARTLPSEEYVTNEQLANLESARLPRLS